MTDHSKSFSTPDGLIYEHIAPPPFQPKPILKALNRVLQPRDSRNKRFTKPVKDRKSKVKQFY